MLLLRIAAIGAESIGTEVPPTKANHSTTWSIVTTTVSAPPVATVCGAEARSPFCGIALPEAETRASTCTLGSCESFRVGIGLSPSSRTTSRGKLPAGCFSTATGIGGPPSWRASTNTLAPAGSLADVPQLAERTASAGVRVQVTWQGEPRRLPPEIDLSAFRIIQESVTNVVRHAGTPRCEVTLRYTDDDLTLEITDEGRGHGDSTDTGFGLAGMRERVAELGDATLEAGRTSSPSTSGSPGAASTDQEATP